MVRCRYSRSTSRSELHVPWINHWGRPLLVLRFSEYTICVLMIVFQITACVNVKEKWGNVQATDTIKGYEMFLHQHPKSAYTKQAREKLYFLRFERARKFNTKEALTLFLRDYPHSPYTKEAQKIIRGWRFQEAILLNADDIYERFIQDYPKGPMAEEAKNRLHELRFLKAQALDTLQDYESFMNRFPESAYGSGIKKMVAELSDKIRQRQMDAFAKIRKVKIAPRVKGLVKNSNFPFFELEEQLSKGLGWEVARTPTEKVDAEIMISASFRVDSYKYF